jgi:hypothetical protein
MSERKILPHLWMVGYLQPDETKSYQVPIGDNSCKWEFPFPAPAEIAGTSTNRCISILGSPNSVSQNQQLAAVMAERFFEQRPKGSEAPILRLLLEGNANLRASR